MKKLWLFAFAVLSAWQVDAQQLKTPQPSTAQTIKQDVGLGSIELSYSRPNAKGRKVFGDLVPYNKVWRTGANNATTLNFTDEYTIGGVKIKPGKYGLLTIPGETSWTLIISKQTDVTSPAAYKQSEDVVRVNANVMVMSGAVETFTMQFANVKDNGCELHIMWDKTAVALPITTEVDSKVMMQIEQIMNGDSKPYYAAASYYAENGKDLNIAAAWYEKAIQQNPKAYWVHYQLARTYAKLGKKAEALAASQKSLELAKEQKNEDYVALNQKLQQELK
ncbi:MAG: DUF2911 domain-containing protein [Chitinophagaceae bacterium]